MQKPTGRHEIPLWAGLLLIAAVIFVIVAPTTPTGSKGPVRSPAAQQAPPATDRGITMEQVRALARQTHGDWSRLSEEDQHLISGITGGHGPAMLRMTAQEESAKNKKTARTSPNPSFVRRGP